MIYLSLAVAICVCILTVCIDRAIEGTPVWAVALLALSAFTFGFILGENK